MKIVLWARFSPRPNAQECESCDVQLTDGRRWAAEHGHEVVAEFRADAFSGGELQSPELEAAVDALSRGYGLCARAWDRFYRDTYALTGLALRVVGKGARLISWTEGEYKPDDENDVLMFEIKAAIAKYQRSAPMM